MAVHPRVLGYRYSSKNLRAADSTRAAIDQVEAWLEAPSLTLLAESYSYWNELRSMLEAGWVVGPRVHDARIAALCIQHAARELWNADRDFGRFPGLTVVNPLIG